MKKTKKKTAVPQKESKLPVVLAALLTLLVLLSACGKQEPTAGDYLYVPYPISDASFSESYALSQTSFYVTETALYYLADALYRIPLEETLDFSKKEQIASREELAEESNIVCYAVDAQENLYYCTTPHYSNPCITLHKRSAAGETLYSIQMEEENTSGYIITPILAVAPDGSVYITANNTIQRYDENGNLTGVLSLDEELNDSFLIRKSLMRLPEGRMLFLINNSINGSRNVYEIQEGSTPKLSLLKDLSENLSTSTLFEGLYGPLIGELDGRLYQYHPENGSRSELLRWEDSNIYRTSVQAVVQLTEEQLLILTNENRPDSEGSAQLLFLLVKTPAEDIPQKELITLASLFPNSDLEEAVVKFNRSSAQYHVTIESYGATAENSEGAAVRLDSSLTSKELAPDLLDLSYMDIPKYADADALEDLNAYIEKDGSIQKEDYLGNLLDGYTLHGKLVCIPKAFLFMGAWIGDERALEAEDWTMASLMAVAEKYDDVQLFSSKWNQPDVILRLLLSDYILEQFIDWENGSCSLDSPEFCNLLEWILEQTQQADASRAYLLNPQFINGFERYHQTLVDSGGELTLRGLPATGSRMSFPVSVDNVLGIVANSRHKEGAWAFLAYFLQTETAYKYSSYTYRFPTKHALLEQIAEDITTPNYVMVNDRIAKDENGNPIINPESAFYQDGILHEYYSMEKEDAEALMNLLRQIDFTPDSTVKQSMISILSEETEPFFKGEKTAQEAAAIIQNRIQLLLSENH